MPGIIPNARMGMMRGAGDPPFYAHETEQSLIFDSADTAYLSYTGFASRDSSTIMSISFWIKVGILISGSKGIFAGGANGTNFSQVAISTGGQILTKHEDAGADDWSIQFNHSMNYGDWNHVFMVFDTTQGTDSDRIKLWVNGRSIPATGVLDWPSASKTMDFLDNVTHWIGRDREGGTNYFDGYLAEMHVLDGITGSHTDFGEFKDNAWIHKSYTGSYGTAGLYLDFSNTSNFGEDQSGNNHDFTDNNLAAGDQSNNTPTNSYPTLGNQSIGGVTYSKGNKTATCAAAPARGSRMPFGIPEHGKWYWEMTGNNTGCYNGIGNDVYEWITPDPSVDLNSCVWDSDSTSVWVEGVEQTNYWTGAPGTNPVGICVDMDNKQVSFQNAADGQGTEYSFGARAEDHWYPVWGLENGESVTCEFDENSFSLTPPAGYKALTPKNVVNHYKAQYDSVWRDREKGFNMVEYTGNTASLQITGMGFTPDMVMFKDRTGANDWVMQDQVGTGTALAINPGSLLAAQSVTDCVTSWDADGVTIGDGSDLTNGEINVNGNTYTAYGFKADPRFGFDIVAYTGTGIAHAENHNLGGLPELILIKNLDQNDFWVIYHEAIAKPAAGGSPNDPEDYRAPFDEFEFIGCATCWDGTAPTNTQFTVGTADPVNAVGENFVAYLWRSIPGYSHVFGYVGGGVNWVAYTGFRPRFWLVKNGNNSGSSEWYIWDKLINTSGLGQPEYLKWGQPEIPGSVNATSTESYGIGTGSGAQFNENNPFAAIAFADTRGLLSSPY